MKLPCIETIHKHTFDNGMVLRVWIDATTAQRFGSLAAITAQSLVDKDQLDELIERCGNNPRRVVSVLVGNSKIETTEKLCRRTNAVELLDRNGSGVVFYTKWP